MMAVPVAAGALYPHYHIQIPPWCVRASQDSSPPLPRLPRILRGAGSPNRARRFVFFSRRLAGAAMMFSSVSVVCSSLELRRRAQPARGSSGRAPAHRRAEGAAVSHVDSRRLSAAVWSEPPQS